MINHHHGNGFDFLPVYSVMALRRGTNTIGHGHFGQNIGLTYVHTQEEESGVYTEKRASGVVGKTSNNVSVSLTAVRNFSLEMVKAVRKTALL